MAEVLKRDQPQDPAKLIELMEIVEASFVYGTKPSEVVTSEHPARGIRSLIDGEDGKSA